MVLLKQLTENFGKAVVVTIHQPSSQMFHMFTHLLLLADGHVRVQVDLHFIQSFFIILYLCVFAFLYRGVKTCSLTL